MTQTPALMIQGTSSNCGKSLIVAGLCRAFAKRGLSVRPFKPQNMSNNAAVTPDGHEIGRAQALQARACGVAPSRHMNPILLKPEADGVSQIVLQGTMWRRCRARDYYTLKPQLLPFVLESLKTLETEADLVLCEGAGSPGEVNLRHGDVANMGFAQAARVPVALVGDIERGGVIAQLVGTVALLNEGERALLRGYIVNKFRGDPRLFESAHPTIEMRTGISNLGVVPWLEAAGNLPKEDVLGLEARERNNVPSTIHVVVPRLPRIANFDDIDPLGHEPNIRVTILQPGKAIPGDADLVLLCGSKATIDDLAALRSAGWDLDISTHVRRGGTVLGLCGGYQMLGRTIADPDGVEGPPRCVAGLGLLPVDTVLSATKTVRATDATHLLSGEKVHGYEIHVGRTRVDPGTRPLLSIGARTDGAISADGRIMGCYMHGLLGADGMRHAFLRSIRADAASSASYDKLVERSLDELGDHLEKHVDLGRLLAIARDGA